MSKSSDAHSKQSSNTLKYFDSFYAKLFIIQIVLYVKFPSGHPNIWPFNPLKPKETMKLRGIKRQWCVWITLPKMSFWITDLLQFNLKLYVISTVYWELVQYLTSVKNISHLLTNTNKRKFKHKIKLSVSHKQMLF